MARIYRIGLIGTGARGETFARELREGTPTAELFGICDHDEDRLHKFGDYMKIGLEKRYSDTAAFLASRDLDAVVITTPDFTHADLACQALEAGKHVYLEKPLAHTLEGCYRIIAAQQKSGATLFVGFNLRASPAHQKLKEIVESGVLGKIISVASLEQLGAAHGAAYHRRWHRKSSQSGGLMNHKGSHDLDIVSWILGHHAPVVRMSSFGGRNFLTPEHAPKGHGSHCSNCPREIIAECPYRDVAGHVFPITADKPMHKTTQPEIYGNDLCAYSDEKDIIDNQTVMWEWADGVRGSFNLQMFQNIGRRETRVWGEKGMAELSTAPVPYVRVVMSATGDVTEHRIAPRTGGHGGTDKKMLGRFVEAIEGKGASDSGMLQGLSASLLAFKADEARLTGKVIEISPRAYTIEGALEAVGATVG